MPEAVRRDADGVRDRDRARGGYVLTRRTFPLAGAGFVEVLLPLMLVAAGAPFAPAIVGVFLYRIVNLWLPLVPALLALRTTQANERRRSREPTGRDHERAQSSSLAGARLALSARSSAS
jgi:hypothetical protein